MQNHAIINKMPCLHLFTITAASHILSDKNPLFLFARIMFSACRWLQMIMQRAKAADDLGTQVTLRNTLLQLSITSFFWISGNITGTELLPQSWLLLKAWVYHCFALSSRSGDEVNHCCVFFSSSGMEWTERWGHGKENISIDCTWKEIHCDIKLQ